jgi:glycosyltransferase involved in cell wall biosynthesis
VVITSHGPDITGVCESDKFHKQANKAAKECEKIIAISNNNKEKLNKIYDQYKDKIITIPNGYNPEVFYRGSCNKEDVLKSFQISKIYDKIVCFAGRLTKNKGIDILLKSAKLYEKDNILTLIAGFGGEYQVLNQLKEDLGLQNVIFVGDQSHDNLRKIYSISDVCVVPSRQEAFGLVALEAIACGTPVIASKQGGMVDFVTKEVGRLVEREDVNQLAKTINQVLEGEIIFDKRYLQNYAKENYSQEILMDELLEVYKEAINCHITKKK